MTGIEPLPADLNLTTTTIADVQNHPALKSFVARGDDLLGLGLDEGGRDRADLLREGADLGLVPAGLGARDTLRVEAALPLYGHELDDDTSPLEAGLDRFVKRDQGGFLGAEAIEPNFGLWTTGQLGRFGDVGWQ